MAQPEETQKMIVMQADKLTKQQSIMQADHTYIHAGIAFTIALDLGSISAAYHIAFETPAASSGYVHYRPGNAIIAADADSITFLMREGITSYTGGTAYTPFNRNRNHPNTSFMTVKYNVTPTLGTPVIIDTFIIGSTGNPASKSGGAGGSGEEIILKPSTIYLFTFTPGGATNVTFQNFWYEESDT
jgi:hypothetical protein